jgi:hypothetical protein
MNFKAILLGLLLMGFGLSVIILSYGIGILCMWPLLLIGFLLFISGIFFPSRGIRYFNHEPYQEEKREMKRICPHCGTSHPINIKRCPKCGKRFDY